MSEQIINGYRFSRLTEHIDWSTKYRYPVSLDIQKGYRKLLTQNIDAFCINNSKWSWVKTKFICIRVWSIPKYK
ncbi:hypothetical protein [Confluentibacter sediminis]|uniref:hypothetical protein n=1 Tax=Confluentibacter sediminis TaxID=2219045 RepID=UPI000DADEBE7|nr:hypothetical protein [Confluentibacter sediminis]